GLARGPGAPSEQRLRRVRHTIAFEPEAPRPAVEVPAEASPAGNPAGPHPQPAQEGVRDPGRPLVSRAPTGAAAAGAGARPLAPRGAVRSGGGREAGGGS